MKYGYFDDAVREYVITDPKTPVKWINYIGTLAFGGFVDHTGGALICKGDPSLNRIVKYIQQMPSSEFKGETLYIRIKKNGSYSVFSPFFVPTLDKYDSYKCHVGLGYNRIVSEFNGIRTECTIFVPIGKDVEIRDIKITNISNDPVEIDVIPLVEYTHYDAVKQFTNADWVPQTMQSRSVTDESGLRVLTQFAFLKKETSINYFTSNLESSSFESDRKRFLGNNEYGSWAHPVSLDNEELSSYEANRGDNVAALLHHLGVIKPGEQKRLITQLGQAKNVETALPQIQKFRKAEEVEIALKQISDFWDNYLNIFQAKTPDADLNSMVNIHNPRQCYIASIWSRYLSYYQLGMGTRGLGFRDTSQDVMSVVSQVPEEAKKLIVKLLSVQLIDGYAMHQFNPLSMEGQMGDAHEIPDRPQWFGDDHLWVVIALTMYLKETGDVDFLNEKVPFYKKNRSDTEQYDTVVNHMHKALKFTKDHLGAHGLPLLGFADWNDSMNLASGAESMFNACLYGKALLESIELFTFLKQDDVVESYKADYQKMKETVNNVAWDGEWYVRYFEANGNPLGSSKNSHGQIHLNAQSWTVIAGFATPERATIALNSAYKKLNSASGIKLFTPGFNGFDPTKGGITTYPAGTKENGGIFLQTNPWAMIAETLNGNGDRAFQYYNQINPAKKNEIIDSYECEPYVYAQNILADEHPQFGLGRNSWLTGTASWCYQVSTQNMLGVAPLYNGLKINPVIPKSWEGFTVKRKFRGTSYQIDVKNPNHVSSGIKTVVINGKLHDSNIIPLGGVGETIFVEVIMG